MSERTQVADSESDAAAYPRVIHGFGDPRSSARDALACAALVAVVLAIGLPRHLLGLDLRDEGFLAAGAVRTLGGEIPNRDFESLQPPFSFYALAALFDVFSPSLEVLRCAGLALSVAIALFGYAFARRLAGVAPSLLSACCIAAIGMPLFNFVPFAVWWGVAFSLLAAALTLAAGQTANRRMAIAAGMISWLALVSRHDQGVYLAISICAYWALLGAAEARRGRGASARRLALGWLLGIALLAAPSLGVWLVQGALPAMFDQLVAFPLTRYAETSSLPWPSFRADAQWAQNAITALYYLPIAATLPGVARTALRLARGRFDPRDADASFATILALAFYTQVYTRSDLHHLVIALPPTFAILGCWMQRGLDAIAFRQPRRRAGTIRDARLGATAAVALAALLGLDACSEYVWWSMPAHARRLELERGGVWLSASTARETEAIVRSIRARAHPSQAILVLPYAPMYYFLADRRNPTRWSYLWPGDQSSQDHATLVSQAQSDPPAVVVVTNPDELRRQAEPIHRYLTERYVADARFSSALILVPRPKPADESDARSRL